MRDGKLCVSSWEQLAESCSTATGNKEKRRSSSTAASKLLLSCLLLLYEDLYLTEQPYGLVCGVETELPSVPGAFESMVNQTTPLSVYSFCNFCMLSLP